jgi:hypothetical protein
MATFIRINPFDKRLSDYTCTYKQDYLTTNFQTKKTRHINCDESFYKTNLVFPFKALLPHSTAAIEDAGALERTTAPRLTG